MEEIIVKVPDGCKAEWVNGVLTLVGKNIPSDEFLFSIGDNVEVIEDKKDTVYSIEERFTNEDGSKIYKIRAIGVYQGTLNKEITHYCDEMELKKHDITERIKSFGDAVKWCNTNGKNLLVDTWYCNNCRNDKKSTFAYIKLRIIAGALNEWWEPTFVDRNKMHFVAYDLENDCLKCISNDSTLTTSLDLIFKSKELAEYAATQFCDIYEELYEAYINEQRQ